MQKLLDLNKLLEDFSKYINNDAVLFSCSEDITFEKIN